MKHFKLNPTILSQVILIIFLLLIGFQVYRAIVANPQLQYVWDWPGHIDKAKKLDWPWRYGWDTTFWGGATTLTYPWFSHLILRVFLDLTHQDISAVVLMIITTFISQLAGVLYLFRHFPKSKPYLRVAAQLGILVVLYAASGDQLGGFVANIGTGGVAAGVGMALFLFFLGTTNPYLKAILFGFTLLTHTLTAFLIGLVLLMEAGLSLILATLRRGKLEPNTLIALLGGMAIGAPWWLTIIDPAFKSTAINMSGNPTQLLLPLVILVLVAIVQYNLAWSESWLFVIMATTVTFIPREVVHWFQLHGLNGIHFYRFYIFILISLVVYLSQLVIKYQRRDLSLISISLIAVSVLIALMNPLANNHHIAIELDTSSLTSIQGRTLDVSEITQTILFPRAPEHLLANLPNRPGSAGLFYESSQTGLQFYTLGKALNPNYFANGTMSNFFQDLATQSAQVRPVELANLLGISNISYISPDTGLQFTNVPIATIGTIIKTNEHGQTVSQTPWRIAQMKPSALIEPLSSIPAVDPSIDLGTWWLDSNHRQLVTKTNYPKQGTLQPNAAISHLNVTPTKISFIVNSAAPVPVNIKFTYNKYWHNSTDPSNPPIWITPGFMTLTTQGYTELVWQPPIYIALSYLASISSFGLLLLRLLKPKTRR